MSSTRAARILVLVVLALTLTAVSGAGPRRTESIIISLTTDKSKYSIQDTVKIALAVSNRTGATVSYDFPTSQWYDLQILKEGKVVWRWSRGKLFTQSFTTLVLKPGQSRTFAITWDLKGDSGNPVLPGNYVAAATFPVEMSATRLERVLTVPFSVITPK